MPASKDDKTIGERLAWAYANLAMAHAAVSAGSTRYGRTHYMIRSKLLKGLRTGSMSIGSLLDDERVKIATAPGCAYCGLDTALTIDHLIPRHSGGPDSADNTVWACRSCNSSKNARDLFRWWFQQRPLEFPPLLLIRRHLKVAFALAAELGLMELEVTADAPFDIASIPTQFPAPSELRLWATATRSGARLR
jgi:hypothetical protein